VAITGPPPVAISSVVGMVSSDQLTVTFTEGVYTNPGQSGALQTGDFILTDIDDERDILIVNHTAGSSSAILTLSSTLDDSDDIGYDTIAAVGNEIYDGYDFTVGTDPVTITWDVANFNTSQCPTGATSLQLNEYSGSPNAFDEQFKLLGTVGNPAEAFQGGDGYFHGDGVDDSTYIYIENEVACLEEGSALTYEVRFKPDVIDLDSEELNPGNTLDRTVQVLFERKYTYNVKISRADFWGDGNPPPGKAFVYIWYHPNNSSEGGRNWHQAFADEAGCYIEANHWYRLRLVFNSGRVGGIPVNFFIDDQGTDGLGTGEAWAGYINCTRPPGRTDTYRATEGNEIYPVAGKASYPFSIGALATNKNYTINGIIDWVTYNPAADYTGIDAPAPAEANAGDGQVQISWGPVAGAASYNIYWDTSSGVTTASVNKITGVTSPYTHTGRTNGTYYYYIVTAMKDVDGVAGDEEIASSQVKAMPINAAPSASPANVVAEGFNKAVMLTWDDASFATSYNIYWDTTPGVTTASVNKKTGATSPHIHVSRTNGTTYYYIITSVNSYGEYPVASGEVSGTANQNPTNITAVAGNEQVEISWSAVTGATSYNIYWEMDSEVTRATATKITGVTSPYTHSGLTNGTRYYYIVTAVHPTGETFGPYPVNATPAP
jgi:hypothetical protein